MFHLAGSQADTAQEDVHIYLRNSQKKAYLIRIQKEINHHDLCKIVSEKLKIESSKLMLFLKGEEVMSHQTVALT